MQDLNRQTAPHTHCYPERILQFGGGNFLRGFFDWMVDRMNRRCGFDAGITVVQSREQVPASRLEEQDGLYHVYLRGIKDGEPAGEAGLIDCVNGALNPAVDFDDYFQIAGNPDLRFIVSNTTEAGIVFDEHDTLDMRPQNSFPGKLTAFLYRRYRLFDGAADKGVIILCCELIERNGDALRSCVFEYARRWGLDPEFCEWIETANVFCNTLVDRIVPGFPAERIDEVQQELGYRDRLVVEAEYFHFWVIEAPSWVAGEFPAREAGLNVIFTDDLTPYRERKVRILNGAHTASFAASMLYNRETVQESVEDPLIGRFMKDLVFEEICPNIDMPTDALHEYAESILERFRNPYIRHYWQSIALNAVSKWETRLLPSLRDYHARTGELPERIVFSLAALIAYYRGGFAGRVVKVQDSEGVIEAFQNAWAIYDGSRGSIDRVVEAVLSSVNCWTEPLTGFNGLDRQVAQFLFTIESQGVAKALTPLLCFYERSA